MNLQSKFGNCIFTQTLIIGLYLKAGRNYGQTDRQTDGRTNGRTDDPITRCPRRTFQAGGIKINSKVNFCEVLFYLMHIVHLILLSSIYTEICTYVIRFNPHTRTMYCKKKTLT